MKPVSSALSSYLDNTTAAPFVAHLFAITPQGAATVYLTSHSSDITVGGHAYLAGGGSTTRPLLRYLGREQRAGLDPGELSFAMLADRDSSALWGGIRVQVAALDGAFDGAWVRVERIFGSSTETPDISLGTMPIHEGPVSRVNPASHRVDFRVSDGREELSRLFPKRIIQPGCNWQFGSAECGISLASHTFTYSTGASCTRTRIYSSSLTTQVWGYFQLGVVTIAGQTRGVSLHVPSPGYIDLDRPLTAAPGSGVSFTVQAGCEKTLAVCGHNGVAGKFGVINSANYGGFPFVPNPDSV